MSVRENSVPFVWELTMKRMLLRFKRTKTGTVITVRGIAYAQDVNDRTLSLN